MTKFKHQELAELFNLSRELENMLVDDYFYSFDLKTAGDYVIRLRQLLEIKLTGQSLKDLQAKDKKRRKESHKQLKDNWKDYACQSCGYLPPNTWNHQYDNCHDCCANYK